MDIEAAKIREIKAFKRWRLSFTTSSKSPKHVARATSISATLISLLKFFFLKRSTVENRSSFMQKWGCIDLRFTKRTASVTMGKEVTNEVELGNGSLDLSTSLPRVFQKLPSNNISTIGLKYSVFHNECPNFKTLYFCNHEPQMNETCTTWTTVT